MLIFALYSSWEKHRKEHDLRILSVGEVLWDVFGRIEILGGAPLNFSAAANRLGHSVSLLTAVGTDARGQLATATMQENGLTTELVQTTSLTSTGTAYVTTDNNGDATFVIKRPAAFDCVELNDSLLSKISYVRPEWIYFGTLAQSMGRGEQQLKRLLTANPQARCFYDVNLREGHWNLDLVQRLSRLASIIKLNETEAETLFELSNGATPFSMDVFCRFWSSTYGGEVICITQGDKGCSVWRQGCLTSFPGYPVSVVDTVGAGDAFAAAFLHGHESDRSLERTARFANALGALVASRAGAMPNWTIEECRRLIESTRQ